METKEVGGNKEVANRVPRVVQNVKLAAKLNSFRYNIDIVA